MKLKVIELFAGIGSQAKALKRQNIAHEVVGISEWDVNAIISYDAIHTDDGIDYTENMSKEDILEELKDFTFSTDGKKPCNTSRINNKKLRQLYNANKRSKNLGDITKMNNIPNADLWTYSFPCQDLSVAGKRAGLEKGTRSGLLYEVERLLEIKKTQNELPSTLLLENVKNLVGKQFKSDFENWVSRLDELGYNTYWEVINAKNCGVPQNRERVFAISILKQFDKGDFKFAEPFDNGVRLKDMLEDEVDEKYYINGDRAERLLEQLNFDNKDKKCVDMSINTPKFRDISNCITARYDCGISNQKSVGIAVVCEDTNKLNRLGNIYGENFGTGYAGNVWDDEFICPTLTTAQGGGREPHVVVENNLKFIGGIEDSNKRIDDGKELSRNFKEGYRVYSSEGIASCQKSNGGGLGGNTGMYVVKESKPKVLEVDKLDGKNYNQNKLVLNPDGLCNTIQGQGHSGNEPKILDYVDKKYKQFIDKNGYVPELFNPYNCCELNYVAPTQSTQCGSSTSSATVLKYDGMRIRKLTPKECWRLMGFDDEDIDKCIAKGVSNSQLYKQAGNSIVVQCLELIFKNLFKRNT